MDPVFKKYINEHFVWIPEKGIGYYPVSNPSNVYNYEYLRKYIEYAATPMGRILNHCRVQLVNKYTKGLVLDIGIGSAAFILKRGNCLGYDINPFGVRGLKDNNLFFDPYIVENFEQAGIEGITFFDSLEHIREPGVLLEKIKKQFVFVSIPIFKDLSHILRSRHFRPDEHYYYFTMESFIEYMSFYRFKLLACSLFEIQSGREDIYTFVFKKRRA